MNPALAARAFLFSWPTVMTTWVKPGFSNAAGIFGTADAVTGATPLASLHQGSMAGVSLNDLFIGNVGGCLGETSALLLLLGALYLLARRVISLRIPLSFVGTVALLGILFPHGNDPIQWMGAQVLSGGVILGAFFMATDYASSPTTAKGKIVFGLGCGLLLFWFRFGKKAPAEWCSFAILLMNVVSPLIERVTGNKSFGEVKK
jgi:electron transport complex protein RnfD